MKYGILGVFLLAAGVARAADYNPPVGEAQGIIEKLELASSSLIIQGQRYWARPEVKVEIGNTYGALTMLKTGMRVAFAYRHYEDGRRELIELRELSANEELLVR